MTIGCRFWPGCLLLLTVGATTISAQLPNPAPDAQTNEDLQTLKRLGLSAQTVDLIGLLRRLADKKPGPRIKAELAASAVRLLVHRRAENAVDALLDYWPIAENDWLKEQVLQGIGRIAVRKGKVHISVDNAVTSQMPHRRAAAAYVLAARGGLDSRKIVRKLLGDVKPAVRQMAQRGLLGRALFDQHVQLKESDAQLLQQHKIANSMSDLLQFLGRRTLDVKDVKRIEYLIEQLGHANYPRREQAMRRLLAIGPPALPLLRAAVAGEDLERTIRAAGCIEIIEQGPGPALPAAAVRRLAACAPAQTVPALLAFVPFADDEFVEEEILRSLCMLNLRGEKSNPDLRAALDAVSPLRRAAAAYVVGKTGDKTDCVALSKMLFDSNTKVRFRAAQGLLAAGDRRAVPALIALLDSAPGEQTPKVEETLARVAGAEAPLLAHDLATDKGRKQRRSAWTAWWNSKGQTIDLASVHAGDHHLDRLLIVEYDSNQLGGTNGRLWESDRTGRQIWEVKGLRGPMDAQLLGNGRFLVAENVTRRIVEIDRNGRVHWEYQPSNNPLACQRLANGNTFIATYNELLEVNRQKQVMWSIRPPGLFLFSAQKLRDGRIICMSAQGDLAEYDPRTGKQVHIVKLGASGWCDVKVLPNGRYLVAQMGRNIVREVDRNGKSHWSCDYQGAFRATPLPNGNILVISMTQRKIAEFNRAGRIVREIACKGRPWRVIYR